MASLFPGGIDLQTDPTATSAMNNPSHAGLHATTSDGLAAAQAALNMQGPAAITGILGQTMPDWHATGTAVGLTSAVVYMTGIHIQAGVKVTNIWFVSCAATTTCASFWSALYDKTVTTPVLLANAAAQSAVAVAANTAVSFTMTTPFTTTYSGLYYVTIVNTSASQGTWCAGPAEPGSGRAVTLPILSGPGETTVTTVASASAPITPSAYGAPLLAYIN